MQVVLGCICNTTIVYITTRSDTNYNNIKSLENLFLDDWSMVLVMDDREDVWLDAGKQQHMHLLKVFYR